jgi:hypothetical protein
MLFHINFLSCPPEVRTFIGSVQEDTTRPLARTEQQPAENDLTKISLKFSIAMHAIEQLHLAISPHLLYSPRLVPCNFHLFLQK